MVTQLVLMAHYGVILSNIGRNSFEHVERPANAADTFREGVFAEAKEVDAFARGQLPAVYVVAICLSALAIWPARVRYDANFKKDMMVK